MRIGILFLHAILALLNTVRGHLGSTDVWNPNIEDPYSDVRSFCGNISFTCSQWRNLAVYENVDSCCIPCECSDNCAASGLCCHDHESTDDGNSDSESLDSRSFHYTKDNERCTSTKLMNPLGSIPEDQEYLLVHSCGSVNTSSNIRERCENPSPRSLLDRRPVYSPNTGLNYRNMLCALCNGQNESSVIPWKDMAVCGDLISLVALFPKELPVNTTFIDYVFSKTYSSLFWTPPTENSVAGKSCVSRNSIVSECTGHMSSPTLEVLCANFDRIPVLSSGKVYRNMFCLACSDDFPTDTGSGPVSCSVLESKRDSPKGDIYVHMNIDAFLNSDKGPMLEDPSLCNRGEVYIVDKCFRVECPVSQRFYNGSCVPLVSEGKGFSFDYRLKITFMATPETFPANEDLRDAALSVITRNSLEGSVCGYYLASIAKKGDYYESSIHVALNVNRYFSPQKAYDSLVANIEANNRAWEEGSETFKVNQEDARLQFNLGPLSNYAPFFDAVYTSRCPVSIAIADLQFCPQLTFAMSADQFDSSLEVAGVTLNKEEYHGILAPHPKESTIRVCVSKFYYLKTGRTWKTPFLSGKSNQVMGVIPEMKGEAYFLRCSQMVLFPVVLSVFGCTRMTIGTSLGPFLLAS